MQRGVNPQRRFQSLEPREMVAMDMAEKASQRRCSADISEVVDCPGVRDMALELTGEDVLTADVGKFVDNPVKG